MFSNNTFGAAYRLARSFEKDLLNRIAHIGERHVFDAMNEFEQGIQMALEELDMEVRLVTRDENNLVMWRCLLGACYDNLRIIRMNLRSWGEPEWDWKEVIEAVSFIAAVIENTSTMLGEQTPSPAAAVPL